MAIAADDRPMRPLTADEVLRMVELGILDEDEPVELLGGVLRAVSPKSPAHEAVKMRLIAWLAAGAAAGQHLVRVEGPLRVPDETSLPEPDVSVVEPGDYTKRHPTAALLVIEVASSSLRTDAAIKPALYAAAGVPEYWVVEVEGRRLRIFSEPDGERYASEKVVGERDVVRPRHVDVPPLALAELLAGI